MVELIAFLRQTPQYVILPAFVSLALVYGFVTETDIVHVNRSVPRSVRDS